MCHDCQEKWSQSGKIANCLERVSCDDVKKVIWQLIST